MTKGQVIEALKIYQNLSLGWCPVIKENCRVDCVCYRGATACYDGVLGFHIKKEYCASPMVGHYQVQESE